MNTPYILLVDDDPALLQALPHMMALRIHGVQVDTATSAIGALNKIRAYDYDAIVSDIKMPGIDGLELLASIHKLRPETPTLLITGHIDQSLLVEAMKGGAYDFIQKPIDRIYFVAALHRAIQTRQLQRRVRKQQQRLDFYAQEIQKITEEHVAIRPVDLVTTGREQSPFKPPRWLV